MLTDKQTAALTRLADMLDLISDSVRECAREFSGHDESFPAVVETAALAAPLDGWTPELIEHHRKGDISEKELHALPSWMHFAPEGYNWIQFKYFAPDGVELRSTLVKAAA